MGTCSLIKGAQNLNDQTEKRQKERNSSRDRGGKRKSTALTGEEDDEAEWLA